MSIPEAETTTTIMEVEATEPQNEIIAPPVDSKKQRVSILFWFYHAILLG